MEFADAVSRLERALAGDLPGSAAQAVAAPVPRREWPAGFNPARIRHAASLLLVYPGDVFPLTVGADLRVRPADGRADTQVGPYKDQGSAKAHIVLTVRSDSLGRHSGQVAMPGGVVDPGETLDQAALREAHEEIALVVDGVRVLGPLTPIDIPVSGFRLHPIIAAVDRRPTFVPSDGEVARVLEVPIAELMRRGNFRATKTPRDDALVHVPAFHVGDHEIWGATAMVLAEFLALLAWSPFSPSRTATIGQP